MLLRVLFLILIAFDVHAAPRCKFVHSTGSLATAGPTFKSKYEAPAPTPLKRSELPTEAKAKKLGFKFVPDTNDLFVKLTPDSSFVKIGTVKIASESFLYEWADHSSSVEWIKGGGIHEWEMNQILSDPPQKAGKGYYVSIKSHDSIHYGDAATIFRPKKQMVYIGNLSPEISAKLSKAQILKLKELGIDALQVAHAPTWFSIINHELLIRPVKLGGEYLFEAAQTKNGLENLIQVTFEMANPYSKDQTLRVQKRTPKELNDFILQYEIDKSPYWGISDIFDMKYIASIYAKQSLAEPVTIKKMHTIGKSYSANKKTVDLKEIQSLDQFLSAASKIIGSKLEFRDYGAIMGPELKSNTDHITMSISNLQQMQKNKFLKTESKASSDFVYKDVLVEYPSIENYKQFAKILSPKLLEKLNSSSKRSLSAKESEQLNRELLIELTEGLFDKTKQSRIVFLATGERKVTPMSLYVAFVSIHPFTEGNGRSARLFYEMLQLKLGKKQHTAEFTAPVFDLDLLVAPALLEQTLITGLALKIWIAASKNDQEFLERNVIALRALSELDTTDFIVTSFPEAQEAIGY